MKYMFESFEQYAGIIGIRKDHPRWDAFELIWRMARSPAWAEDKPNTEDTRETLKAKLIEGQRLWFRDCSICSVGLHFFSDGKDLFFQSHCRCVTYEKHTKQDWEDLDPYIEGCPELVAEWLSHGN